MFNFYMHVTETNDQVIGHDHFMWPATTKVNHLNYDAQIKCNYIVS